MKITVFTSNQPRHLALVRQLANVAEKVFAVMECNTVFPGQISDFFQKSDTMQTYFQNVLAAERKIFGEIDFLPADVSALSIKSGDLNLLSKEQLATSLHSDTYIVFGASFIKGWLADFLVDHAALNVHMGISPYYRGSSCNFWALYHRRPEYVGATIHLISKGLDSGDMLFHCLPTLQDGDTAFDFTMRSVSVAQTALASKVQDRSILQLKPYQQDKRLELSYTRNSEFTDEVAASFLSRGNELVNHRFKYPALVHPVFG